MRVHIEREGKGTAILFIHGAGGSGLSWVAFTLLFGARIVFLYMARFRNKEKKPQED